MFGISTKEWQELEQMTACGLPQSETDYIRIIKERQRLSVLTEEEYCSDSYWTPIEHYSLQEAFAQWKYCIENTWKDEKKKDDLMLRLRTRMREFDNK